MAEEVETFAKHSSDVVAIEEGSKILFDGIRDFILYTIIALITLRYGRRWWLLFEGVLSFGIAGMAVAFPKFAFETVLGSLIGDYDDCHNIVIRAYGILFFIQSVLLLLYQNSTDKRGVSAILEGLSMTLTLELIAHLPFTGIGLEENGQELKHYPEKGYAFFVAVALGNLVHLVTDESGYKDFRTPPSCNVNARFDALAQLVIGASLYKFPTELLALMTTKTEFDSAQVVTMAVVASYTIGNSVVSFQAESFTQDDTRQNMFRVRIIECVSLSALILLYWAFTDILTANSLWAVLIYGILTANAYIGMINVPTKIKA